MLRWMCGVTKLDRIRNDKIRGATKLGKIAAKKVQERRLSWYGHACDEKRGAIRKKKGDVNGSTRGRRKRGRTKRLARLVYIIGTGRVVLHQSHCLCHFG